MNGVIPEDELCSRWTRSDPAREPEVHRHEPARDLGTRPDRQEEQTQHDAQHQERPDDPQCRRPVARSGIARAARAARRSPRSARAPGTARTRSCRTGRPCGPGTAATAGSPAAIPVRMNASRRHARGAAAARAPSGPPGRTIAAVPAHQISGFATSEDRLGVVAVRVPVHARRPHQEQPGERVRLIGVRGVLADVVPVHRRLVVPPVLEVERHPARAGRSRPSPPSFSIQCR